MSRFVHFFTVSFVLISLAGCVTTRVMSDYDSSVNFLKYGTYDWLPDENTMESSNDINNTLVNKRIKRVVDQELSYKGYQVDTLSPNFYVTYHINVRERKMGVYRNYGCFHHGHHGHHGHHRHHHIGYPWHGGYHSYVYDETTLTLDIIDATTKELVWRGWTYDRSYGPTLSESRTRKAVRRILSKFPPYYSER